jgi:hypothetical protein
VGKFSERTMKVPSSELMLDWKGFTVECEEIMGTVGCFVSQCLDRFPVDPPAMLIGF